MSLLQLTYLVVDTETTGIDPAEHRAVEAAAVLVRSGQIVAAFTTYLFPGRAIPAGASAIHGLVDSDVLEAPTLEQSLPWINGLAGRADALVAHNAPFDRSMLPGIADRPWLDTLRLSRKLHPEMESHTNGAMRFGLNLRCPEAAGMPAHRALSDAYVTARLVGHLLAEYEALHHGQETTLADLIAWADAPMLLVTCKFGKHKGTPWAEVPTSYMKWAMSPTGMPDMDIDLRHTIEHYLA